MLFDSFFIGGFECSSHRLRNGRRLDLIHATRHDQFAELDYRRLVEFGIRTARDGIRWHLIETEPYHYDFSCVLPMIASAQCAGVQVIWDLFHYGWPHDLDIFSPEFIHRFSALARAFASRLRSETDDVPFISPVNEPSFVSWAGGDAGFLNPFATGRDGEIKAQLIRASIAAIEAVWDECPGARIVQCEPAIHIIADLKLPQDKEAAENYRLAQFQSIDMLTGRVAPELGGKPEYLDILGVNYYCNNQWIHNGDPVYPFHPRYRPFREIIAEFYQRYQRPIFVAETGIEDEARPGWLAYVASEVRGALNHGVPVEGICIYPVLNHPGWVDDRHCYNGLFDYADTSGNREAFEPLARELKVQQSAMMHFAGKQMEGPLPSEA
jgi:beta-glucosidase/6-phospho-beta-glucosidase/beta-galactosidase